MLSFSIICILFMGRLHDILPWNIFFQVGSAGSGKTSAVHVLSQLLGQELRVLSINSAIDTTEILGGFEQVGCHFCT